MDRRLLDDEFRNSPVLLTNVAGVHSFAIAEFAVQACLVHVKGTIECARQKKARLWQPFHPGILRGNTMGLVGFGNIGRRIARIAKAFGMRVIATSHSTTSTGTGRWADVMLPFYQLDHLLHHSDFVVLTTPLTRDTYHLIGPEQFEAMKDDALLVNVS